MFINSSFFTPIVIIVFFFPCYFFQLFCKNNHFAITLFCILFSPFWRYSFFVAHSYSFICFLYFFFRSLLPSFIHFSQSFSPFLFFSISTLYIIRITFLLHNFLLLFLRTHYFFKLFQFHSTFSLLLQFFFFFSLSGFLYFNWFYSVTFFILYPPPISFLLSFSFSFVRSVIISTSQWRYYQSRRCSDRKR